MDFFNSGDWLGEISIFTHEDTIKENQVLEEVHCLEFDLDMLQKHCNSSAETSFYFAQYLANKLIARSYRMSEYMNYSLVEKLAQFIIQYEENGIYSISHTDASEYLNVSYRHVLYIIKKFCDQGILKKEKIIRLQTISNSKSMYPVTVTDNNLSFELADFVANRLLVNCLLDGGKLLSARISIDPQEGFLCLKSVGGKDIGRRGIPPKKALCHAALTAWHFF
ncbi:hypothetical protein [Kineothrix alysoides]|uniref:hypothetical protein n=1 Tax=Kineothrix alysoides TaxID=1469948 RepID=UPI0010476DD8